jgi:hypothetical protein
MGITITFNIDGKAEEVAMDVGKFLYCYNSGDWTEAMRLLKVLQLIVRSKALNS